MGEIFEEYSEKNRADLPPLTIIQGGGTVYRDESNRNLQFDKNSLSNYKAVNPDDFIVHLRSFEGGLEKATCCGLISPAYHTFHGDGIDSDFYYLYFRSKRFIDTDLKPHVYGIRDGRSIDIDGMKTIPIPWTTVNEQRAIGGFYNSFDSFITLHQRKCQYRGLYGCLSWEQRKLGDCVGSTYGGGTPSTSHDEYWGGNIPWIQSSNVLENELFRIDIPKAITQDGLSKSAALRVPGDSIAVVTHVGVGKLVYLPFPYATSQDFVSLSELKGDANFLCYAIHRKLQSELHMVQGSAIKGITKEELLGKAIFLPAAEEQKLVGNQMRAIDNLITLHQ